MPDQTTTASGCSADERGTTSGELARVARPGRPCRPSPDLLLQELAQVPLAVARGDVHRATEVDDARRVHPDVAPRR